MNDSNVITLDWNQFCHECEHWDGKAKLSAAIEARDFDKACVLAMEYLGRWLWDDDAQEGGTKTLSTKQLGALAELYPRVLATLCGAERLAFEELCLPFIGDWLDPKPSIASHLAPPPAMKLLSHGGLYITMSQEQCRLAAEKLSPEVWMDILAGINGCSEDYPSGCAKEAACAVANQMRALLERASKCRLGLIGVFEI